MAASYHDVVVEAGFPLSKKNRLWITAYRLQSNRKKDPTYYFYVHVQCGHYGRQGMIWCSMTRWSRNLKQQSTRWCFCHTGWSSWPRGTCSRWRWWSERLAKHAVWIGDDGSCFFLSLFFSLAYIYWSCFTSGAGGVEFPPWPVWLCLGVEVVPFGAFSLLLMPWIMWCPWNTAGSRNQASTWYNMLVTLLVKLGIMSLVGKGYNPMSRYPVACRFIMY